MTKNRNTLNDHLLQGMNVGRWKKAIEAHRQGFDGYLHWMIEHTEELPPVARSFLRDLVSGKVKRRKGAPRKTMLTDEQIAVSVMVAVAKGAEYHRDRIREDCEAFQEVAGVNGVSASLVRQAYDKTPKNRRREIKEWLEECLHYELREDEVSEAINRLDRLTQ